MYFLGENLLVSTKMFTWFNKINLTGKNWTTGESKFFLEDSFTHLFPAMLDFDVFKVNPF